MPASRHPASGRFDGATIFPAFSAIFHPLENGSVPMA